LCRIQVTQRTHRPAYGYDDVPAALAARIVVAVTMARTGMWCQGRDRRPWLVEYPEAVMDRPAPGGVPRGRWCTPGRAFGMIKVPKRRAGASGHLAPRSAPRRSPCTSRPFRMSRARIRRSRI